MHLRWPVDIIQVFLQFSLHDKPVSICLDISIKINPNIHLSKYVFLQFSPKLFRIIRRKLHAYGVQMILFRFISAMKQMLIVSLFHDVQLPGASEFN